MESRKILAHQSVKPRFAEDRAQPQGYPGRLREEHSQNQRYGDSLAIGMVDIDHFKQVNDTYCHQTRDDVLGGLTIQLQESLRENYPAGAREEEKFLLITALMQFKRDCRSVFKRTYLKVADNNITTRSGELSVKRSIGVAIASYEVTIDKILAAADKALYC